jgi:hypothetical protein
MSLTLLGRSAANGAGQHRKWREGNSDLENRHGLSLSRACKAAVPFSSGTMLLIKAFADLTATTGTPVC